jgi:hypothetical protein
LTRELCKSMYPTLDGLYGALLACGARLDVDLVLRRLYGGIFGPASVIYTSAGRCVPIRSSRAGAGLSETIAQTIWASRCHSRIFLWLGHWCNVSASQSSILARFPLITMAPEVSGQSSWIARCDLRAVAVNFRS